MSDARRTPTRRPDTLLGVSDAAWGCAALWTGTATVLGVAAATVEPIRELGPGAAVLVGAGGASAVALALGASMRGAAAALAAWRGGRREVAPSSSPPAAAPAAAAAASARAGGGDPILAELFAGLADRIARAEEKLDAAAAGGALLPQPSPPRAGSGPEAGRPDPAAEGVERGPQAILDRIAAEAEALERRAQARLDALAQALLPRVDQLDRAVAELRRALEEGDARARGFEAQVFDILRARDAGRLLRKLDAEAADLFDKLSDADERRYPTAEAWRAEYAEWRARINAFWDVLRGYRTGVEQPFAVSEADVDGAGAPPDSALFAAPDMRFRYKMLVVMNERHLSFREDAFSFNARKGSPPEPDAPAPARPREPSLAAG